MDQKAIDRINELARKARTVGLTPQEEAEREALRGEFRSAVRANLTAQLDNTYLVDEQGRRTKLKKRGE